MDYRVVYRAGKSDLKRFSKNEEASLKGAIDHYSFDGSSSELKSSKIPTVSNDASQPTKDVDTENPQIEEHSALKQPNMETTNGKTYSDDTEVVASSSVKKTPTNLVKKVQSSKSISKKTLNDDSLSMLKVPVLLWVSSQE